jgi:N-acetylmuramoyl-L-alanine amidase
MSTNTLFDVATHTKTLSTSIAIMHLAHQGLVDINAPVMNYLAEFRGHGRELITIKDLLQNDTLYPVDVDFFNNDPDKNKGLFSQNKTHSQYLITQRLSPSLSNKHQQGHTKQNNDINFMLLGMVIERVTQLPLDEYVEQAIFQRLSLTNSMYKPLEKEIATEHIAATALTGNTQGNKVQFVNARSDVIHGEVHDEKAYYSMQEVSGHAGLFTTLSDAAVLAQLMVNKGGYGDIELFDERSEFTLGWKKANEQNRWLFGPYASSQAFGHGDANGTLVVIDPEYDLIIVLLSNKYHKPQMDAGDLWQMSGDTNQRFQFTDIVSMIYETILHSAKTS